MARSLVDDIDRAIIEFLVRDGRATLRTVAESVNLSPAPVMRRIARLERLGIIAGYTAIVDHSRLDGGFEAYTQLSVSGSTKVRDIIEVAMSVPEVIEVAIVAGDPGAVIRVRVANVSHLQQVADALRTSSHITDTKTMMVLGTWRRTHARGGIASGAAK